MADYRLSAKVISRASGQSAVASAAYRSASCMRDERTGQVHDFTRKGGLVHEEILAPENAPEWMTDREQLWNAVEVAERRKDAQLAREIQLSLPHELDAEQRRELVHSYVQGQFVDRGMIADIAIHEPGRNGDQRNHHAHVMLTMRELTGEGFGKKNRDWNSPEMLKDQRREWAAHQNQAFERLGLDARVDHRSYEERGIDREPTQHLGPSAHDMEAKGRESRIGTENRERQDRNSERAARHFVAATLQLQIDKQQKRFRFWAEFKRSELANAHDLAEHDLSQRHDRQKSALERELGETYGAHKATLTAELETIDRRLEAQGVRKFVRDAFGRTRADQVSREDLVRTLDGIGNREAERRGALETRHEAARAQERERQEQNRERLERGIQGAWDRREAAGWWKQNKPKPEKNRAGERSSDDKTPQTPQEREKWWREASQPPDPSHSPHEAPVSEKSREDFWRSTSTEHTQEAADYLKGIWDRTAVDEGPSPWSESDFGPSPFGGSSPAPSPGGTSSGGGSSGTGSSGGG